MINYRNRRKSLIDLDYSVATIANLECPIVSKTEMLEYLQICAGDSGDSVAVHAATVAAIGIVERQTGLCVSPKALKVLYDCSLDVEMPLPFGPAWDESDFEAFKNENSNPQHVEFADSVGGEFAKLFTDDGDVTDFQIAGDKTPPRLTTSCESYGFTVCYFAGYRTFEDLERRWPELLQSVIMTTADIHDGMPMDEVIKRQKPLWDLIGFNS